MKNLVKKSAVAVGSVVTAGATFAQDHTAAIEAAQTSAVSNVTAAAVAIIAISAVAAGIGWIISLVRKS